MADWTMCAHPACASSVRCNRHKDSGVQPDWRQSYSEFGGYRFGMADADAPPVETCDNFWASSPPGDA